MKKLRATLVFLIFVSSFAHADRMQKLVERYLDRDPDADMRLLAVYQAADKEKDGILSYADVRGFLNAVYKTFRYEHNAVVLTPSQFLDARAGDCDDFAVFAADMLWFYGWDTYVGRLVKASSPVDHAICLVREDILVPDGYFMYDMGSKGLFVPVDYGYVGNFSEKQLLTWELEELYDPRSLWGSGM